MSSKKDEKQDEVKRITVDVKNDLTGEEEERLNAIVDSKHSLLCSALEVKELPILVTKDKISFPWFTSHDIDGEEDAYRQLVAAIIKMAKEQKRVTAKDKKEENEKFAMRIFLVRLGLKGDEYKLIRRLMSRNLSGNSSWKNGKPEKKSEPEAKPKKTKATEKSGDTKATTT